MNSIAIFQGLIISLSIDCHLAPKPVLRDLDVCTYVFCYYTIPFPV